MFEESKKHTFSFSQPIKNENLRVCIWYSAIFGNLMTIWVCTFSIFRFLLVSRGWKCVFRISRAFLGRIVMFRKNDEKVIIHWSGRVSNTSSKISRFLFHEVLFSNEFFIRWVSYIVSLLSRELFISRFFISWLWA